eukprot:scaffold1016_cov258-Pinguiococcus_pyrenoidosus.AAC.18
MSLDRKGAVQQLAVTLGALCVSPAVSRAAKYGDFGVGSPEVLNPSEAVKDTDAIKSKEVQDSLDKIRAVHDKVKSMRAAVLKDPQVDILGTLRTIPYADVRIAMYTASNTVFDEDTQRGTDRLIRVIMQDISEAELAAQQKPGVPRTERKAEALRRKMQKLDSGIDDYLKFFS